MLKPFKWGIDPEKKLIARDGTEWCADVFETFITANQPIPVGESVVRSYTGANQGQQRSVIHIYCSPRERVGFVDDDGVEFCGTLCLDLPLHSVSHCSVKREIRIKMLFGEQEIKATVMDVATKRQAAVHIDFQAVKD